MKILILLRDFGIVFACLLLLFFQHYVCFDVFDSNLWYLYLLALISAICQYLLLCSLKRNTKRKWLIKFCFALYVMLAAYKLFETASFSISSGTCTFCFALDFIGAIIVGIRGRFAWKTEEKTGDGLRGP